jgi:hypothetical protein
MVEHMFDLDEFEAIISCGMCSQSFAMPAGRTAMAKNIHLPQHPMLGPMGEPPRGVCRGSGLPPMRHRSRAAFDSWWRKHHGGALAPDVLDGAGVRLG